MSGFYVDASFSFMAWDFLFEGVIADFFFFWKYGWWEINKEFWF